MIETKKVFERVPESAWRFLAVPETMWSKILLTLLFEGLRNRIIQQDYTFLHIAALWYQYFFLPAAANFQRQRITFHCQSRKGAKSREKGKNKSNFYCTYITFRWDANIRWDYYLCWECSFHASLVMRALNMPWIMTSDINSEIFSLLFVWTELHISPKCCKV